MLFVMGLLYVCEAVESHGVQDYS